MVREVINVKFLEIVKDSDFPQFRMLSIETEGMETADDIEQRFRELVESNPALRQIAVFWESPSCLLACEATRDSHRPRELLWLHRGLIMHLENRSSESP